MAPCATAIGIMPSVRVAGSSRNGRSGAIHHHKATAPSSKKRSTAHVRAVAAKGKQRSDDTDGDAAERRPEPFRMTQRMVLLDEHPEVVVIELDDEDVALARELHRRDVMAQACRRAIVEPLLDALPEFRRGGVVQQPSDKFKLLITEFWLPFLRDAMDAIWTYGVVPIAFRPIGIDQRNDLVPVVPLVDYGRIVMRYDQRNDQRSYVFIRRDTGEIDPTVLVIGGFGYDPLPDGRLTSVAATLAQEAEFFAVVRRSAVRAERARTDPAVIIEKPERIGAPNAPDEDPLAFTNVYGNSEDGVTAADAQHAQRQRVQAEAVRRQRAAFAAVARARFRQAEGATGGFGAALAGFYTRHDQAAMHDEGDPLELPNFFELQPGQKLAQRQAMPEARKDYLELQRMYQELVCMHYGVPRDRTTGEGTRVHGNEKATEATYRQSMLSWRTRGGRLLTMIYAMQYARQEAEAIISAYEGQHSEPMTPEEAFAAGVSQRIEVTLPYVPTETNEEMTRLYAGGVMSWPEYRSSMRRNAALPVDQKNGGGGGGGDDDDDDGAGAWPTLVRSTIAQQMNRKVYEMTPWSMQVATQAAQSEQTQLQVEVAKHKATAAMAPPAASSSAKKKARTK